MDFRRHYIILVGILVTFSFFLGTRVTNTTGVNNIGSATKDVHRMQESKSPLHGQNPIVERSSNFIKVHSVTDLQNKRGADQTIAEDTQKGETFHQPIQLNHNVADASNSSANLNHHNSDTLEQPIYLNQQDTGSDNQSTSAADRQTKNLSLSNGDVGYKHIIDPLNGKRLAWEVRNRASLLYGVDVESRLQKSTDGDLFHPLPQYRNPCWREELGGPSPNAEFNEYCKAATIVKSCRRINGIYSKRWKDGGRSRLRCLPFFFFLGVMKSGTTDMKYELSKHPNLAKPSVSEINWWNRRRQGANRRSYGTFGTTSFDEYLSVFDLAAEEIDQRTTNREGEAWHPLVTYDGSSPMAWEHDGWESLPANKNRDEPVVTYIDSIGLLRPDAKLILMFREPVDRLFSYYCMARKPRTEHFHNSTVYAVRHMNKCIASFTLRKCIYDTELAEDLLKQGGITLRAGLYAPFYMEWAKVFTQARILVVRSEDYYKDRVTTLNSIGDFLGLGPITVNVTVAESINRSQPKFQRLTKPKMLPETRKLLEDFYMPYNKQLAQILNDERFLWLDKKRS